MAHITINGKTVSFDEPLNLVEAARRAGIEIPTLCYQKETGAMTTCMLCVVRDCATGRMVPACATLAQDGMCIDTEEEAIRQTRREILRMLLNEHLGDCRAPCSRICPAAANIPLMLRHMADNDAESALRIARRDLIFPAILGRICSAPCEKGCRRKLYDRSLAIQHTHGLLAEQALAAGAVEELSGEATGKKIAVVGAGLAGLAAAFCVRMYGHQCDLFEKASRTCESLRSYPEEELPAALLDGEIDYVIRQGIELYLNHAIGQDTSLESLIRGYDAVIVACRLDVSGHETVFVAKEESFAVRAVAQGKMAARHAHAFLTHAEWAARPKRFDSRIAALHAEELETYAAGRVCIEANPDGEKMGELMQEAVRCLHCDCRKPVSCKLRQYAEAYGLGGHFHRQLSNIPLLSQQVCDNVVYDPGKCIKCGLCVAITREAGVPDALTFVGRGLSTQVQPALSSTLKEGLGAMAVQCVCACPTGALAFCDREERP